MQFQRGRCCAENTDLLRWMIETKQQAGPSNNNNINNNNNSDNNNNNVKTTTRTVRRVLQPTRLILPKGAPARARTGSLSLCSQWGPLDASCTSERASVAKMGPTVQLERSEAHQGAQVLGASERALRPKKPLGFVHWAQCCRPSWRRTCSKWVQPFWAAVSLERRARSLAYVGRLCMSSIQYATSSIGDAPY